jgi:ribosomal protein S18 acetylase RimI-like enzyme
LVEYRPFRNTDPPQLAEVWRSQTGQRGLMQPMSMAVLERFVFSKPTFDRQGLIVAVEGDKLQGFVHAGFGPTPDQRTLSTEIGVTCVLMLRPEADPAVATELIARSQQYLTSQGSKSLVGGGNYPLSPFYYGLYGGSEISGVLDSDVRTQAIFCEHGYQPARRTVVLQRDLARFRPVVDRQQMQIRRHTTFEAVIDSPTTTWWEACIFEPFDRTQFSLRPRDGGAPVAIINVWNMETMAGAWGVNAVGLVDLQVAPTRKRQGLATYLLGEAFRHLHAQGVALAEVHVADDNSAALALYGNLGFEQVDRSVLYRKD